MDGFKLECFIVTAYTGIMCTYIVLHTNVDVIYNDVSCGIQEGIIHVHMLYHLYGNNNIFFIFRNKAQGKADENKSVFTYWKSTITGEMGNFYAMILFLLYVLVLDWIKSNIAIIKYSYHHIKLTLSSMVLVCTPFIYQSKCFVLHCDHCNIRSSSY